MFNSTKIIALCFAIVALMGNAHAEQEVAQTFGLITAGLNAGASVGGTAGVG
ncbi:hypothetical protein PHYSODRAFT_454129, partial [Phytophthora sojae]